MKKLVLIDGNAILHKGYHALPPFRTAKGELVNAVYGFASVLLNLLNEQQPDFMAVAFDVKGGTFRNEKSVDYKATRTKAPDDLYAQIGRIKDVLAAFKVPIFEAPGFEADDVLGTLARQGEARGDIEVLIVTGDLDTLQLVGDRVKVLALHRGFSNPIVFDRAAVYERCALWPRQIADFKGLAGDSSDNIKGVNGIGKKTAVDLLQKFETLEGIYEAVDGTSAKVDLLRQDHRSLLTVSDHTPPSVATPFLASHPFADVPKTISGAVGVKLAAGREDALLSKELASIVCDVPGVNLDLPACEVQEYEFDQVAGLFEELGFRSLMKKLGVFEKRAAEKRNSEVQTSLF